MCLSRVQRAKSRTNHNRSSNSPTVFPSSFILVIHSVFFPLTYHLLIFFSNLLSLSASSFIFFLYLCWRSRNHSLLLALISTSSISFLLPLPPSFLYPSFPSAFPPYPSLPSTPLSFLSFLSSPCHPQPPILLLLTHWAHPSLILSFILHLHFVASSQNPGLNFFHPLPLLFHSQVCSQSFGAGRMWPSGCDGLRKSSPCGQSPADPSRWTAKPCCCSPRKTSATDPPTLVLLFFPPIP